MPAPRVVAVLTSYLLLLACADGGRRIGPPPAEEPEPAVAPTTVEVANFNWSRVDVYAEVQGQTLRLGYVETGHTETFELPASTRAAFELELVVDPIASDAAYQTGPIPVLPGTVIQLRVENNLRLSSYSIRGT